MENKSMRFLSLLLALVMVISLMPVGHVHAEEAGLIKAPEAEAATDLGLENIGDSAEFVIASGRKDRTVRTMIGNAVSGGGKSGVELINDTPDVITFEDVPAAFWTITKVEGGYTISVDGTNNVQINGNNNATLAEGAVVQIRVSENGSYGTGYFEIFNTIDGTNYFLNYFDSFGGVTSSGCAASVWSDNDPGSQWQIYKVTEKVPEIDIWNKAAWTKVSVDTETVNNETEGLFEYAFDGKLNTIWHSNWKGGRDVLTGENTFAGEINFGQEHYINQFSFLPRQDDTNWANGDGVVTMASLYVKDADDTEWKLVAEHQEFEHNQDLKTFTFEAQNVQYVRFVAERSVYDGWVAVSEFYIDYVEEPAEELSRVEQLVAEMSLRDKITQMMMVDFRCWGFTVNSKGETVGVDFTEMNDEVRKIIEDYNFGSIILFANNIKETEQSYNLVYAMQEAAIKDNGLALIVCADQEGGSVYRLGSGTALPGNMALGATYANNGTKYAFEAGKIIGSELSVLGINGNLAPVVDVNNNANNPVIGLRSYGDDATMVGELASASIAGMAEYNVIGTAKHFPGHGDTATDSHYGLPIVDKSLDVLMETELAPYTVAIEEGIEMIMTAHILYPQQESDKIVSNKTGEAESLPATMSDDILTGLLKEQMGFEGIVVTDAMNMAGISNKWDQVQSCVIAVQAGVDLICMPCRLYCQEDLQNLDAIIDGLIAAVEDGTIPMERIDDAVTRILTVKENRGILDYKSEDYSLENAKAVVGSAANREMEREIAAAAVTVVKNECGTLPLKITSESKVLMLVPYTNEISQMLMAWNRAKEAGLIPEGAQVDYFRFSNATISSALQAKLDWADTYIINSEISSTSRFSGNHWLYAMPTKLCDYAAANGKTAIISSVDKPYDVQMYANANAIVAAYGCKGSSVDPTEALIGGATGSEAAYGPNIIASVEVILGTYQPQGKLPVNIPVYDWENNTYSDEIAYARGYGLTYADAHDEHKAGDPVTENEVPATCKAGSYDSVVYCVYCNKELSRETFTIEPSGEHTPAQPVKENEVPATCTVDGSYDSVVYCSVCGEKLSSDTVPVPAAHTPADPVKENEVPATCAKEGSYDSVVYCSVCEAEISRTSMPVDMLEHTPSPVEGTPATFDAAGLTDGESCSVCGAVLVAQEPINKLDYNEGIVPVEVLKATAGDIDYNMPESQGPAEFVLDDNFGTLWHTDWYGNSRDNHWIQFELTDWYAVGGLRYKPRTDLNREGQPQLNGTITEFKIQISNDGVNFEDVITGNWEANQNWKTVEFEAVTAKYIRLVAVNACTDNDSVFASAAEIRLVGVETEHEHSYTPSVTDPTCTEAGYTTYTCFCGHSYTEAGEAALGHNEVTLDAKPATCTEDGLTEGKKCTRCQEVLVAQTTIPALGHNYENGTCTNCGDFKNPFTDVNEKDHEAFYNAIMWAVEEGVTTGATDTTFNPNGNLLRAQFVTFLWRAAGEPEPTKNDNPFTDVTEADYFYKAVLWAVENEITNGISATEFGAYKDTNRAQAVTFLWRYLKQPAATGSNNFTDVEAGLWYEAPINWAVGAGVTNGLGNGIFGINTNCNRAQAVTFLYRAIVK